MEEVNNFNASKTNKVNKGTISFNSSDILFALTINKKSCVEGVFTLIGKMIIIKEDADINLSNLSKTLGFMKMDKLYIFSIDTRVPAGKISINKVKESSLINYVELGTEDFIKFLKLDNHKFTDYNKDCLYILRNGSYIDIKNMLTEINGSLVKLGRGGGQKAHLISPLDFRLTSYLLAMFNFDSKLISCLNTFDNIDKNRYLLYFEKNNKF